ncbi:MAG: WG repeat-containing protein [Bacteroidales bacterium]|nr:WG repeat-containing protein [Bacteroidales bacterium]
MKKILFCLALIAQCAISHAQEAAENPSWVDLSWIHFAATGGTDENNALLQYMLFTDETMEKNRELFDQLNTLMEEVLQVNINQTLPDYLVEMEKGLKETREKFKDNPQMLAQIDAAMKEFEKQKKEALAQYTDDRRTYTYDPATMLQRLKLLAVNQKVYTGWSEAGNGLYAVTEVPRYASLNENAHYSHAKITFDEKDYYRWGLIDGTGRQVLPPQYGQFNTNPIVGNCYPDDDVMFLYKQEADGKVYAGAVDYKGQVRIPFIYDENRDDVYHHQEFVPFEKNGKIGWVSINGGRVSEPFEYVSRKAHAYGWLVSKDGKNYGFVSSETGTLVIPLKYKGFWEEGPVMMRFDGKLDFYDENFRLLRTADAPKD